jgi:hypothetical protein
MPHVFHTTADTSSAPAATVCIDYKFYALLLAFVFYDHNKNPSCSPFSFPYVRIVAIFSGQEFIQFSRNFLFSFIINVEKAG